MALAKEAAAVILAKEGLATVLVKEEGAMKLSVDGWELDLAAIVDGRVMSLISDRVLRISCIFCGCGKRNLLRADWALSLVDEEWEMANDGSRGPTSKGGGGTADGWLMESAERGFLRQSCETLPNPVADDSRTTGRSIGRQKGKFLGFVGANNGGFVWATGWSTCRNTGRWPWVAGPYNGRFSWVTGAQERDRELAKAGFWLNPGGTVWFIICFNKLKICSF